MDKETKAALKAAKERKETLKMSIRTLRSDVENPMTLQKSIEQDEQTLKMIQRRLDANRQRLISAPSMLKEARGELVKVNQLIKKIENSPAIRQLLKLQGQIDDLQADDAE